MLFRTLFKSIKSPKKRKHYKESRREFYKNKNALVTKSSVYDLVTRDTEGAFETRKEINFYSIPFGTTLKDCKSKMGKPNFEVKKGKALNSQSTIFYRLQISDIKCILQLHFFNDKFFFGQVSSKYNTGHFSEELLNILREKYKLPKSKLFEVITDEFSNKIEIIEGMAPCIRYTTGNQTILTEIREALFVPPEPKKRPKQERQNKLLLDLVYDYSLTPKH